MKLYDGGRAPNPRRVRIFFAEKGVTLPELVPIDIGKKEHRTPEFTRINPSQRLPVLVLEDGTALAETIAICRYIESLHPAPPLFGAAPKEAALIEMWNRRIEPGCSRRSRRCSAIAIPRWPSLRSRCRNGPRPIAS